MPKWWISHKTKCKDLALFFHEDERSLALVKVLARPFCTRSCAPCPRLGQGSAGKSPSRRPWAESLTADPSIPLGGRDLTLWEKSSNTGIYNLFKLTEFMLREINATKNRIKGLWTHWFLAASHTHRCFHELVKHRLWKPGTAPQMHGPSLDARRTSKAGNSFSKSVNYTIKPSTLQGLTKPGLHGQCPPPSTAGQVPEASGGGGHTELP